jgi:hypothetical protein
MLKDGYENFIMTLMLLPMMVAHTSIITVLTDAAGVRTATLEQTGRHTNVSQGRQGGCTFTGKDLA